MSSFLQKPQQHAEDPINDPHVKKRGLFTCVSADEINY